ncbi:MAG: YggS family pyridoxal phosphate enzyme [Acidimicrobiales bacterium]|nr:MAG: YggS family pyridoxal phosphate enzyme [Acidimicrobiales bacterium]
MEGFRSHLRVRFTVVVVSPEAYEVPARPPRDAAELTRRLDRVRDRIARAGGDPDSVTVVAVTKGFGADMVDLAAEAGIDDLGENYAQEVIAKFAHGGTRPTTGGRRHPELRLHFIGQLQRNKVKKLAGLVDVYQSVDRPELVSELSRRAPGAELLVQVDCSGDDRRGGCPPSEVSGLVALARAEGLRVSGLMTVAPLGGPEVARRCFRTVRVLADELGLETRSMGMSADLEIAVSEGSTMVRIGTDLFGPRPDRHAG